MEKKKLYIYKNNKFIVPDSGDSLPDVSTASVDDVLSLNSSKEPVWSTPKDSLEVVSLDNFSDLSNNSGKVCTYEGYVYYPALLEDMDNLGMWINFNAINFTGLNQLTLSPCIQLNYYAGGDNRRSTKLGNTITYVDQNFALGGLTFEFPIVFESQTSPLDSFIRLHNAAEGCSAMSTSPAIEVDDWFVPLKTSVMLEAGSPQENEVFEFDFTNSGVAQMVFGMLLMYAKTNSIVDYYFIPGSKMLLTNETSTTFTLTALDSSNFTFELSGSKILITYTM